MLRTIRAAALAGFALLATLASPVSAESLDAAAKGEFEALIRSYILENPEIVQEALVQLEEKKQQAEAQAAAATIDQMRDVIYNSTRQVVLGDPKAPITIVEFFDYNCGYCKRALGDTMALLAEDKDVRIVLKEFPILGPGSVEASRVAIALNLAAPDKSPAFHEALLSMKGQADEARALQAVADIGVDVAAVKARMDDPEIAATIEEAYAIANRLGLTGTPTYIIGDEVVFGAVGVEDLRTRIEAMRACGKASC